MLVGSGTAQLPVAAEIGIVGDIGNPASFDFSVIFRRMEGIGPNDAVSAHPDRPRVLAALVANARALAEAPLPDDVEALLARLR